MITDTGQFQQDHCYRYHTAVVPEYGYDVNYRNSPIPGVTSNKACERKCQDFQGIKASAPKYAPPCRWWQYHELDKTCWLKREGADSKNKGPYGEKLLPNIKGKIMGFQDHKYKNDRNGTTYFTFGPKYCDRGKSNNYNYNATSLTENRSQIGKTNCQL